MTFSPTSFLKVLFGVLLLQAVTVLLVIAALRSTDLWRDGPLFVLVGAIVGLLAAMWFSSLSAGRHKLAVAEAREGFSREREKLRVKAEREKARLVAKNHKASARQPAARRTGSFMPRNGALVVTAVGVGTVLLFSQFVTLGLAALAAVGGSMVGYRVRGYQESGGGNGLLSFGSGRHKAVTADEPKRVVAEVKRLDKSK